MAKAAKKSEETVMLAFVGAAPTVRIDWTPKAEGATGLAAMASVQAEQQVWISEGVARTRTTLTYAISRAELGQLMIDVPADQKVVNVFDANVRQWSVETVEGRQRITAQLFEPAKSTQQVTVELEKFTGDKVRDTIEVPVVKAVGVGQQQRQQGVLVVQIAEGLRAEAAKANGLLQVDAKELPPALQRDQWAFSYRYATADYQLALSIEKVQPQIVVDSLVEAYLEPERLSLDLAAIYTIEKAGVFRLELDIPAGYEVRQVRGAALAGAAPVQVDTHHLEGQKKTRLVVNLSRKAIGTGRPGGPVAERPESARASGADRQDGGHRHGDPAAAPGTAERATGRLVIYAPESLRVNPRKSRRPAERLLQGSLRRDAIGPTTEARRSPAGAGLRLHAGADRVDAYGRAPQTAGHGAPTSGGPGRGGRGEVPNQLPLQCPVQRRQVAADRRAGGGGRRAARQHARRTREDHRPAARRFGQELVAWSLSGESELIGGGRIELSWEKKIEKLDVGKSVELPLPYLKPQQVDLAWGQIVLVKSETIDVHESGEPKSLRPIDPQHDLMSPVASAARAFEFHDDWTLSITATRYQLEEIKRTSIERAVVRMVVTPAKIISVQALYRLRSARQRLAVHLPEGAAFDTQPLRINGHPVALEKGRQNEYFVPLVATTADMPFVLELRYTLEGDGSQLDLPDFPQEPAVVKAYLGPDAILMYSLSGEILAANILAAKVYGVSTVGELLAEVKSIFDFLNEEGKAVAADHFLSTLVAGSSEKQEYLARIRDGRMIPVEVNSSVEQPRPANRGPSSA